VSAGVSAKKNTGIEDLPLGVGQPAQRIRRKILPPWNVVKNGTVLFNEETPPEDMLCLKGGKGEIAVISAHNMNLATTKQHCPILPQSLEIERSSFSPVV
jgi:hypothetical protein